MTARITASPGARGETLGVPRALPDPPSVGSVDGAAPDGRRDLERTLVRVRWFAIAFGVVHAIAWTRGDPGAIPAYAWPYVLMGALNVCLALAVSRTPDDRSSSLPWLAAATDVLSVAMVVARWAGDDLFTPWPLLIMIPLATAVRFQLAGAWVGAGAAAATYVLVAVTRDDVPVDAAMEPATLVYRLGLIALVAGLVGSVTRQQRHQQLGARQALESLRATQAWQSRMVSTLGHDVRGPLGTLVRSAEVLRDRGYLLPPDTRVQMAGAIVRQGVRVQQLASDLLDLARLEVGSFELHREDVDVADVIEEAIGYLRETHPVQVCIEPGLRAWVDPQRLTQIVANLVTNGLRHGTPPVEVVARGADGRLTIEVIDHGEGVPPEREADLFGDGAVTTHAESVGLGLWIVNALTVAHGGRATYDRQDGTTHFRVTIPGAMPSQDARRDTRVVRAP